MKITFDRIVYNFIKDKILTDISRRQPEKNVNYEFEIRFGELNKGFRPSITPELAAKLRKVFTDNRLPYNYTESKVEIFRDKIRKITTFDKGNKTVRFEKKDSSLFNKYIDDNKDICICLLYIFFF